MKTLLWCKPNHVHTYTSHASKYSHSSHPEADLHTCTHTHRVSSGYITGGMTSSGQWYIVYLETDWLYVRHTYTYTCTLTQILVYTHLHNLTIRHSQPLSHAHILALPFPGRALCSNNALGWLFMLMKHSAKGIVHLFTRNQSFTMQYTPQHTHTLTRTHSSGLQCFNSGSLFRLSTVLHLKQAQLHCNS